MAGSCEYGKEPSVCMTCWALIDQLKIYLLTRTLLHGVRYLVSLRKYNKNSSLLSPHKEPPEPVAYRGGVWGVQTPPPQNSEDIGGVLDRMSKKNRRLDFLL